MNVELFTAFGQKVRALPQGYHEAGEHQFILDGKELKPGIYVLKLTSGTEVISRKISVMR